MEQSLHRQWFSVKIHLFWWILLTLTVGASICNGEVPLEKQGKGLTSGLSVNDAPPAPLTVSVTPLNPSTCPVWNLQLTATVSGGTAPYTYFWTGSGAANLDTNFINNPTFSACPVGIYTCTCTVTDHLGAQASASTNITIVDAAPVFGSCVPNITECGAQNISWETCGPDIQQLTCPSVSPNPSGFTAGYWVDNGPWVWQTFHAGKTGLCKGVTIGLYNCDHLPFTLHAKIFPGEPDSLIDAEYPNTCPIWEYDTLFTVAGGAGNGIYTFIIPDNVAPYMQAGANWYTICLSGIGSYDYNAWQHGWWLHANPCNNPTYPDPMPGGGTYGFYDYNGTQQPPGYYHTFHLAFNTNICQIPGLTVTDGCAVKTLISSIPSGSFFNMGTTPVTYTATNTGGNSSQCTFNVTINNTSVPAPPVSNGDQTTCSIAPAPTLSVTVPGGETVDWYSTAVGGIPILSGSTTYVPTVPGTYWAQARFIAGGCTSGTRTPVTWCVVTLIIHDPPTVCPPGPVNLTAASITAGSSFCVGTYTLTYWKNAACTTVLPNPNAVTVAGTYYIKLTTTSPSCSTSGPVHVTFYSSVILVITNPAPVCAPNTIDLTAPAITAGSTLPNCTLSYWMDAACTIPLANPTAVAVSGTYYIKATSSDNCTAVAPVVVVINPVDTITLTSAAGTDNQTVCVNTPIVNITYATTGATGATVTGLPAGVTGNWLANVITISGIPTVSGTFPYTINLNRWLHNHIRLAPSPSNRIVRSY